MNETGTSESGKSQLDKFRQTERELDTDGKPERFQDSLGKLAKHGPVGQIDD